MLRKILLAASAVSALVIAGPAMAQASSGTTGSAGDHNGATTSSTTDVSIQASVPINSNNASTKTATLDSYNSTTNTDNSTHASSKSAALDSFNSSTTTNTDNSTHSSMKTDTLASNNTSNRTDTVASNNTSNKTWNNTSNKTATLDSYNTSTSTDNSTHTKNLALDSGNTSGSYNSDSSQKNGNWHLMAVQDMSATAAPVTSSGRSVSFSSGSNSINGSAFAAYAGILNQAWNTGLASNAQAATNIAAQGTVTF